MKFVRSENLSKGMRLAKPIYNKNGVLLYDRDTKLSKQAISSIINFKLIGIYILEPAEPLPPMTEDDKEFERFQTMNVFGISEDWELILMDKKPINLERMAKLIQDKYSTKAKKIDCTQTLRSEEDAPFRHALNVAILAALMASRQKMQPQDVRNLIKAALLYDIGYMSDEVKREECPDEETYNIKISAKGNRILNSCDYISSDIKDIVAGRYRLATGNKTLEDSPMAVRILQTAQDYDYMTGMKEYADPMSDVSAIRYLLANSKKYGVEIIGTLVDSIKILYPGVCVEMTDGTQGLVIRSNPQNVLRPIILLFSSNEVLDLSKKKTYDRIQIADIMKTMDRRISIDPETIKEYLEKYADIELT